MKSKLFAHPDCWKFMEDFPFEFMRFGCGPGRLGDFFVPDSLFWLSIKEACQIHDWYYRFYLGDTEEDREAADRIFLNNMLRIIEDADGWFDRLLAPLRRWMATTYYKKVRWFGAPAWFECRNKPDEFKTMKGIFA